MISLALIVRKSERLTPTPFTTANDFQAYLELTPSPRLLQRAVRPCAAERRAPRHQEDPGLLPVMWRTLRRDKKKKKNKKNNKIRLSSPCKSYIAFFSPFSPLPHKSGTLTIGRKTIAAGRGWGGPKRRHLVSPRQEKKSSLSRSASSFNPHRRKLQICPPPPSFFVVEMTK